MQGVAPATVVGRYINECWNHGRIDLVDELVDPDFLDHLPFDEQMLDGIAGLKVLIESIRTGFDDMRINVEDMVAEDDRVVARFQLKGTHCGLCFGMLPSHRQVQIDGIAIFRVDHHQIIDQWCMIDRSRLMQQLGVAEEAAALRQ